MRVTFLGTGTSRGVPVVGCSCSVCTSSDPRNKRLRSSILVESDVTVVVDTSSDFRQQMLAARVSGIDALVFTHHHADHVLGLDDVFPYSIRERKSIPLYASARILDELRITFRHLFADNRYPGTVQLSPCLIEEPFKIGSLLFEPVEVFHGKLPVLGFRIGKFAYVTDVSCIPEQSMQKLKGLDCLVLDGLRYKPHPTHFSIDQAVDAAEKLRPTITYLIHMCHDVDHEEASGRLPEGVKLAYDGLKLEFSLKKPLVQSNCFKERPLPDQFTETERPGMK